LPSDANLNEKEIDEIGDLTSIWIRYWCNALYLAKFVRSVIIILDTSFSDPGPAHSNSSPGALQPVIPDMGKAARAAGVKAPLVLGNSAPIAGTTQDAVLRTRSIRPHVMSSTCTLNLPRGMQEPSWFAIGKSLDDPADSLRVSDTLNEAPFYFGTDYFKTSSTNKKLNQLLSPVFTAPSRQWASRHAVFQACRDTELAYERLYYPVTDDLPGQEISIKFAGHGSEQGKFSHYLYNALRYYFPADGEPAIPLETYPILMSRILSSGKDEFENQHPVSFIGESLKHELVFSRVRVTPTPSMVHVEATHPTKECWIGTGSAGSLK